VCLSTQSLRDVRDYPSEVIDRVEHQHERVVATRNGKPAAVILSPEDLAQLQETIDVLSDPRALADIREDDAAYACGDVIGGTDAVRQLRSRTTRSEWVRRCAMTSTASGQRAVARIECCTGSVRTPGNSSSCASIADGTPTAR
jgi:antitoxin YefM